MDKDKIIDRLRKRNITLNDENERLKKQLKELKNDINKKNNLFADLNLLKQKWEREINKLQKYRKQYTSLIEDLKKIKTAKTIIEND